MSLGDITPKYRLGRSKPVDATAGSRSIRISMISSRTSLVAVAVKALTTGRTGSRSMNSTIFK